MCGIVGYVGRNDLSTVLLDGLRRLEYRGYDSAGVASLASGKIELLRGVGKLGVLQSLVQASPLHGTIGLGHTRWATHGKPSQANAHPHVDCGRTLAVVHNGIIENFVPLKARLSAAGHRFASETDTEVAAHLIEEQLTELSSSALEPGAKLLEALRRALSQVRGAYALAVVWTGAPDAIAAAKTASPLVLGLGHDETFLASDVPAFLKHTREAIFLDDGELVLAAAAGCRFIDLQGREISKRPTTISWDSNLAEKAGYRHFMLKETHEQPEAVENTLRNRLLPLRDGVLEREAGIPPGLIQSIKSVHVVACGTAHHAGMVGKYLLERFARIPTQVETASEFRYREPIIGQDTLVIAISQSGETADTIAAVQLAKQSGAKVLSICNTLGSTLTRSCDYNLYTHCGPECGVASTKAFIGQLAALNVVAIHVSAALGRLKEDEGLAWTEELSRMPSLVRRTLALDPQVQTLAREYARSEHFIYIGRTINYPTAIEGALKLKEISYIHAEGYPAGEMKHGPLALVDQSVPVLAIATHSTVFEKVMSNIEEARARGGRLIALCTEGERRLTGKVDHLLELPAVSEHLSPIVNIIPLQLLAYHIADLRGCDVDQPRNLAKSVTVE